VFDWKSSVCTFNGAITGTVNFVQAGNDLLVNGVLQGLASGPHGFHIHQYGDLGDGCKSAGAHYNPHKKTHGAPTDVERHVGKRRDLNGGYFFDRVQQKGDFGNVVADASGSASIKMTDTVASVNSIVGRSLVVHSAEDDLGRGSFEDSKTTGHAGSRLGMRQHCWVRVG
jgi:Cu-Zn family superoxide dismutase